jgi:hypothetical protein
MNTLKISVGVAAALLAGATAQTSGSQGQGASARVIRRYPAAEAKQAVAVDDRFFYAIDDAAIGKYEKTTGRRVGGWQSAGGSEVKHLNSGIVFSGQLFAAHSNYPATPMVSSIEVFDTERMAHVRSIPLPRGIGSATWVDQADGDWWVTFANYAGTGGEPGKGPETTALVRFDSRWQQKESWRFPAEVIARWEAMSSSGGFWTAGHRLVTTGHHARELYVLQLPTAGGALILRATIPMESEGQGIALDRTGGLLFSMQRKTREVLVSQLPPLP